MCALLDSYDRKKINYCSLDPKDSEHNSQLTTKVMHELRISVYVYPKDYKGYYQADRLNPIINSENYQQ